MTGICMQPAVAIPRGRNIAFDNKTDPDSGEFIEGSAHTHSDLRLRSIRNPADRPVSRSTPIITSALPRRRPGCYKVATGPRDAIEFGLTKDDAIHYVHLRALAYRETPEQFQQEFKMSVSDLHLFSRVTAAKVSKLKAKF
jgi:hypothetical protein